MKTFSKYLVCLMVITLFLTITVSASEITQAQLPELTVKVNGEKVTFENPILLDNARMLIPMEEMLKALDIKYEYTEDNGDIKSVLINGTKQDITITLGSNMAIIQKAGLLKQEELIADSKPQLINDIAYIPLRYVLGNLGFQIDWDPQTRSALISSKLDIIPVERPVKYEIISPFDIKNYEELKKWYEPKYRKRGIFSLNYEDYTYILVCAGEKSTGGYSIDVGSITMIRPDVIYFTANVNAPGPGSIVTTALTYPHVLIKIENENIEQISVDFTDSFYITPIKLKH